MLAPWETTEQERADLRHDLAVWFRLADLNGAEAATVQRHCIEGETLRAIATAWKLSGNRVGQIYARALTKLRRAVGASRSNAEKAADAAQALRENQERRARWQRRDAEHARTADIFDAWFAAPFYMSAFDLAEARAHEEQARRWSETLVRNLDAMGIQATEIQT